MEALECTRTTPNMGPAEPLVSPTHIEVKNVLRGPSLDFICTCACLVDLMIALGLANFWLQP
jgi:hypothetical protein